MARLQTLPRQRLKRRTIGAERGVQALSDVVQFGKIVVARLDQVPHPVRWRRLQGRPAAFRLGLGPAPLVSEGPIQTGQGLGGGGQVLGQSHKLMPGHVVAVQSRVRQKLRQGLDRNGGLLAQKAQVNIIGLCQPQQKLRRNGPLVALDMVEIGRRNTQIGRHGRLGQAQLAPQTLQTPPQEQLAIRGRWHGTLSHTMTDIQMS